MDCFLGDFCSLVCRVLQFLFSLQRGIGKGERGGGGGGKGGGRRETEVLNAKYKRSWRRGLNMILLPDSPPAFWSTILAGEEFNYMLVPGSQHSRNQARENKVKYDCVKSLH